LVGGTSTDDDISDFKTQKPQIVVGCPGRVYDLLRRRVLQAKDIRIMILDEADEMLSVGFKDQVYNIFQYLNTTVQVGLFSATMSEEMHSLSEKFLRNPVKILVKADALTLEGIVQYYVALEDDAHKYDTLKDIYKIVAMSQCIIYCNSIKRVVDLTDAMQRDDFPVCCIHSGMDKKDRDVAFTEFKQGKHRVLISSNVTARGIDVQNVGIVINFDVPHDIHTYLHRIGRSGRWGRKGKAINFITRWDLKKIKEIEVYYQTSITELPGNFNID
jgi:translation initiation factor 4A